MTDMCGFGRNLIIARVEHTPKVETSPLFDDKFVKPFEEKLNTKINRKKCNELYERYLSKKVDPLLRKLWETIGGELDSHLKNTDARKVKVYSEAICSNKVVNNAELLAADLAEKSLRDWVEESQQSATVVKLVKSGSKLMVTENKKLYDKAGVAARDCYIAKNIDKTLGKGEIGVLFIGAGHKVEDYLSGDIVVEKLPKSEEALNFLDGKYEEYQKRAVYYALQKCREG